MTETSCLKNKIGSSQSLQQSGSNVETFLVFSIEGQKAALSVDEIKEVASPALLDHLPNHIDQVAGLMNLRGDIIPVLDLARKSRSGPGLNNKQNKKRVVVIPLGETKIGLLVDNYMQVTHGIKLTGMTTDIGKDVTWFRPYTKSVVKDKTGYIIPLLDNIQLFEQLMARMAENVSKGKGLTTVPGKEEVHHG